MSRIRYVKPGFFKNEDLCSLSFAHRLCYEGLWVEADREGRLEDRPKRLKAEIFPYDEVDMEALLAGLAEAGFILRYEVGGRRYIAVPNDSWHKHQRPRRDEVASVLPPPPNDIVTGQSPTCDAEDEEPPLHSDEHAAATSPNQAENAGVAEPPLDSDGPVTTQCVGKGNGNRNGERNGIARPPAAAPALPFTRPPKPARTGLLRGPDPNCYRDGPGPLGVPQTLHAEFVELRTVRGMAHPSAVRELDAFYERWVAAYTAGGERASWNPEPDRFKFWRARHAETWPPNAVPSAPPQPTGTAVPSAAATRRLLQELGQ